MCPSVTEFVVFLLIKRIVRLCLLVADAERVSIAYYTERWYTFVGCLNACQEHYLRTYLSITSTRYGRPSFCSHVVKLLAILLLRIISCRVTSL